MENVAGEKEIPGRRNSVIKHSGVKHFVSGTHDWLVADGFLEYCGSQTKTFLRLVLGIDWELWTPIEVQRASWV